MCKHWPAVVAKFHFRLENQKFDGTFSEVDSEVSLALRENFWKINLLKKNKVCQTHNILNLFRLIHSLYGYTIVEIDHKQIRAVDTQENARNYNKKTKISSLLLETRGIYSNTVEWTRVRIFVVDATENRNETDWNIRWTYDIFLRIGRIAWKKVKIVA